MIRKNLILFITNILCLYTISFAYDYSNWQYEGTVKINTITANIQNDVTDFPLLIRLSSSNFDFSQAHAEGIDVRFSDQADNPLPFVIERWENEVAEIWVKINTIKGDDDQQYIRMYWGNQSITSVPYSSADIFQNANGYVSAYFLDDDPNYGEADKIRDVSASGYHGTTNSNMNSSDLRDGIINKSLRINEEECHYISLGCNIPAINNLTNNYTVNVWLNSEDLDAGEFHRIISSSRCAGNTGFSAGTYGSHLILTTYGIKDYILSSYCLSTNTDYHVGFVMTSQNDVRFYVNGEFKGEICGTYPASPGSGNYYIGASTLTNCYFSELFDGKLDQLTISSTARSDDYIKLIYENQKPNSNLVTITSGEQYTLNISVSGNGSISLSPSGGSYSDGQEVEVTASPIGENEAFLYWSGDLSGDENPTTVTMNSAKNITAHFDFQNPEQFSISNQPQTQVVELVGDIQLSVSTIGESGNVSYQWYNSESGELTGETQSTCDISVTDPSQHGEIYWVKVTDDNHPAGIISGNACIMIEGMGYPEITFNFDVEFTDGVDEDRGYGLAYRNSSIGSVGYYRITDGWDVSVPLVVGTKGNETSVFLRADHDDYMANSNKFLGWYRDKNEDGKMDLISTDLNYDFIVTSNDMSRTGLASTTIKAVFGPGKKLLVKLMERFIGGIRVADQDIEDEVDFIWISNSSYRQGANVILSATKRASYSPGAFVWKVYSMNENEEASEEPIEIHGECLPVGAMRAEYEIELDDHRYVTIDYVEAKADVQTSYSFNADKTEETIVLRVSNKSCFNNFSLKDIQLEYFFYEHPLNAEQMKTNGIVQDFTIPGVSGLDPNDVNVEFSNFNSLDGESAMANLRFTLSFLEDIDIPQGSYADITILLTDLGSTHPFDLVDDWSGQGQMDDGTFMVNENVIVSMQGVPIYGGKPPLAEYAYPENTGPNENMMVDGEVQIYNSVTLGNKMKFFAEGDGPSAKNEILLQDNVNDEDYDYDPTCRISNNGLSFSYEGGPDTKGPDDFMEYTKSTTIERGEIRFDDSYNKSVLSSANLKIDNFSAQSNSSMTIDDKSLYFSEDIDNDSDWKTSNFGHFDISYGLINLFHRANKSGTKFYDYRSMNIDNNRGILTMTHTSEEEYELETKENRDAMEIGVEGLLIQNYTKYGDAAYTVENNYVKVDFLDEVHQNAILSVGYENYNGVKETKITAEEVNTQRIVAYELNITGDVQFNDLLCNGTINAQSINVEEGTVTAKEFQIGEWVIKKPPDYVFAKDYNLRSLEEVRDYIDKHSHLPEIPSAKEITEQGVGLVRFNMALLKKIEEMTLYILDLREEMDTVKKVVSKQSKMLKERKSRK